MKITTQNMPTVIARLILSLWVVLTAVPVAAQTRADVLVLGDSQISFGAGAAYLDFFAQIDRRCASIVAPKLSRKLGAGRTVAIGVRSSSLHSWAAREGRHKDTVCKVDETFGVNASMYGANGRKNRQYVQVGQDPGVQFCREDKSALEGVFEDPATDPKLLILAFLGNSAERWANSQRNADRDVQDAIAQLPKHVPCVFLTTVPVFEKETNDLRMQAQTRISQAFEMYGPSCEVVQGFGPHTRDAIEGQPQYFRRDEEGEVVDPLHPGKAASVAFVALNEARLCRAISRAIE